ncbi:DUF4439 domain-containing protein [Brachybacterium sp. UNK5269]|uniref:DUF4439 domain-containing protein n=1 Tax=Brachybacterium sp. UNK5269 TaxID=3408576 RepID=UPI003BAEC92F
MPCPVRTSPPAPRLSRRGLLRSAAAGALALVTLAGCGPVALGGPQEHTPPPPGIDDLYRADLLAVIERAIAGTEHLVEQAGGIAAGSPALSAALDVLASALPVQRTALLTGAQAEREREARQDPRGQSAPPPPADAPTDTAGLVAALVELRDLAVAASRQVSGSLARPTAGIAAHSAWIALRLRSAAGTGEVTPSPTAEQIVPGREVPATDPPSVGAQADFHTLLEQAQQEEWYAGYLHEVLAARTEGEARERHLGRSALHRARGQALGLIAEEEGAPVVPRQALYPIPGGTLDPERAGQLPTLLAQGLLVDHVSLVGAAPFAHRPLSIAAALAEAELLAPLVDRMEPLPSLEAEDPADG